jgi:LPS O-antigen subunit length determinant protein (WzzB/FepE family)
MSVVIVITAVIVIVAVAVLLSMLASRRRATSHHIGLPELGSLSKANQTDGGVRHTNAEQHTEAEESKS